MSNIDPDLLNLLSQYNLIPQQQTEPSSPADMYAQMYQQGQSFDPSSFYNAVTGGAGNVKPGYRADDMLALLKYQQDVSEAGLKGYTGQQQFGLDQEKFNYQKGRDTQEDALKYGDPQAIAAFLAAQLGGTQQFIDTVDKGGQQGLQAIGNLLGWADKDGNVAYGMPEITMLMDAVDAAKGMGDQAGGLPQNATSQAGMQNVIQNATNQGRKPNMSEYMTTLPQGAASGQLYDEMVRQHMVNKGVMPNLGADYRTGDGGMLVGGRGYGPTDALQSRIRTMGQPIMAPADAIPADVQKKWDEKKNPKPDELNRFGKAAKGELDILSNSPLGTAFKTGGSVAKAAYNWLFG